MAFKWTVNPAAPAVTVRKEDVLNNYSLTYDGLTKALTARYSNFRNNSDYYRIRKALENNPSFAAFVTSIQVTPEVH